MNMNRTNVNMAHNNSLKMHTALNRGNNRGNNLGSQMLIRSFKNANIPMHTATVSNQKATPVQPPKADIFEKTTNLGTRTICPYEAEKRDELLRSYTEASHRARERSQMRSLDPLNPANWGGVGHARWHDAFRGIGLRGAKTCLVDIQRTYTNARAAAKENFEGEELENVLQELNDMEKADTLNVAGLKTRAFDNKVNDMRHIHDMPNVAICNETMLASFLHQANAIQDFFKQNPAMLNRPSGDPSVQRALQKHLLEADKNLEGTGLYTFEDMELIVQASRLSYLDAMQRTYETFGEEYMRETFGDNWRTFVDDNNTFGFFVFREPQEDLLSMLLHISDRWVKDTQGV